MTTEQLKEIDYSILPAVKENIKKLLVKVGIVSGKTELLGHHTKRHQLNDLVSDSRSGWKLRLERVTWENSCNINHRQPTHSMVKNQLG
jgi:hypothetical protein